MPNAASGLGLASDSIASAISVVNPIYSFNHVAGDSAVSNELLGLALPPIRHGHRDSKLLVFDVLTGIVFGSI